MEIEVQLENRYITDLDFENNDEQDLERKVAMMEKLDADDLQDLLLVKDEVVQIITDAAKFGIPILEDYHITVVTDDNTGYDFQVVSLEFRKNKIIYLLTFV